jgi:hypothetical protein
VGTVLLFAALLVAVDFSYRRWVRRLSSRRLSSRRPSSRRPSKSTVVIDLAAVDRTGGEREDASPGGAPDAEDAAILTMPAPDAPSRSARGGD